MTGTIAITTILFFVIVRHRWHRPLLARRCSARAFFLTVDLAFFAANLTKLVHGAWLPLAIGLVLFTVMTTWFRGRELVTAERCRVEGPLRTSSTSSAPSDPPVARVPGTGGVHEPRQGDRAAVDARLRRPPALAPGERRHPLAGDRAGSPDPPADRLEIDDLGYTDDRITFVRAKYGYAEEYDVPRWSGRSRRRGSSALSMRAMPPSISRGSSSRPSDKPGMSRWRKRVFLITALITAEPADYFQLPRERTITLGSEIEF